MELFLINRYDETTVKNEELASKNLEKLKKKIELKRIDKIKNEISEKTAENSSEHENSSDEEEIENEEPKKKKKCFSLETEGDSNKSENTEIEDETNAHNNETVEDHGFSIMPEHKMEKVAPIKMLLPYWMANPDLISGDLTTKGPAIASFDYLCETLKKNLKSMKIVNLFPVQETLIPWILHVNKMPPPFRPRDACVSAVTGSGKTLSYALPIVQHIFDTRTNCKLRALVILPVHELAKQVFNVFDKLCNNLKIRVILLTKRRNFELEQKLILNDDGESKVDIVVTTGGRLVEHLFYTKLFNLKDLKFLVIDEADHAMSQVHNDWYHHYIQHIGVSNELQSNRLSFRDLLMQMKDDGGCRIPQKLLFSATLSQDPEKLNMFNLFQPKLFTTMYSSNEELLKVTLANQKEEHRGNFLGKYTTPVELSEFYCITEYKLKPLTLYGLIKKNNWRRFLCFTNTIETSHRLSFVLQTLLGTDLVIEELSSLLPIKIRQKVLQNFNDGKVNAIICSDALARGIDVPNIEAVISYDLPKHLKTYIHRIGRTARAGNKGTAATIIAPDQIKSFEKLLETANKTSVAEMKPDHELEEANALKYANTLKQLQKALELEERQLKKSKSKPTSVSLFEKLQRQVKEDDLPYEALPESWKPENLQAS
ncbi:CLUMA_CG011176, isoform A [Clunio marinus]|uniref:ATP-dependent RNA helicase n=1 Tax=Clunio marinus TaxID=568069 RepID=A0A1J1IBZ4_9DIPT|nr:CLUMA_CG011176, isoform A [Clunio marinus]